MMMAVVLVGCGGGLPILNSGGGSPQLFEFPEIEKAVRENLEQTRGHNPAGQLTDADFEKVTGLYLNYTQVTDSGLKEVAKLQNLKELFLNYTQITDAGLKEVAKMQQLTMLGLSDTKITDAGLVELAELQQLTSLGLDNTQITDAGLKEVAKLQNLEELFLKGTKVTREGVAELKKALPNCFIAHWSSLPPIPPPKLPQIPPQ